MWTQRNFLRLCQDHALSSSLSNGSVCVSNALVPLGQDVMYKAVVFTTFDSWTFLNKQWFVSFSFSSSKRLSPLVDALFLPYFSNQLLILLQSHLFKSLRICLEVNRSRDFSAFSGRVLSNVVNIRLEKCIFCPGVLWYHVTWSHDHRQEDCVCVTIFRTTLLYSRRHALPEGPVHSGLRGRCWTCGPRALHWAGRDLCEGREGCWVEGNSQVSDPEDTDLGIKPATTHYHTCFINL